MNISYKNMYTCHVKDIHMNTLSHAYEYTNM